MPEEEKEDKIIYEDCWSDVKMKIVITIEKKGITTKEIALIGYIDGILMGVFGKEAVNREILRSE